MVEWYSFTGNGNIEVDVKRRLFYVRMKQKVGAACLPNLEEYVVSVLYYY